MELPQEQQIDLNAPIQPRKRGCFIPLTDCQRLVVWDQISTHKKPLTVRLRAAAVRILGPLDVGALRVSIEAVQHRHESLRTRITTVDGTPQQQINEVQAYELRMVDLRRISSANLEVEAERLAKDFFHQRINLLADPLFDALLLRLSDEQYVLLTAIDHMVSDGVSCGILSKEIWAAYSQITQGLQLSLPELPVQFPDYAVWLDQTDSARRDRHAPYWISRMTGTPHIDFPRDPELMEEEHPVAAVINVPFGKALSDRLRRLAQHERTYVPIVFLTVWVIAMSRWRGQSDLGLTFVTHGRYRRAELQNMIGFLIKPLFFRIETSSTDTFIDLIKRSHSEFLSATQHQEFLPGWPQEHSLPLVFNWGGLSTYSARWSIDQQRKAVHGLRIQPFQVSEGEFRIRMHPFFSDTPSGVVATLKYRSDFFARSTIQLFGSNLRLVAEELAQNPFATIGSVPFRSR